MSTKRCKICQQDKLFTEFSKEGKGVNGYLRYECKACANDARKALKALKKVTPPPPDDHKCPICERTAEELPKYGKKNKSPWALDHIHGTMTVRGWLCHKCNLGLGNLDDNPQRVKNGLAYLNKHGHR